jgi:hypothetical protein
VKIFNENNGLERTLNPAFRTQPIREGESRPSQYHKNREGTNFTEAPPRRDLDAGGIVGMEEGITAYK